MADGTNLQKLNLNNFKSSGVYTVEIDQSQNIALPLTTGRVVIGSSKKGPYNTVVLINDLRTLRAVYGDIDPKAEKAGSYFHRTIQVALREGPVYALNVMPLDNNSDPDENLDQAFFTTFNSEAASNNGDTTPRKWPMVEFYNRQKLWFASTEQLNQNKNISLGDDFLINPGGFGQSSIDANKILSFANLGKTNVTIWVKKSDINGFEITANEWYTSFVTTVERPSFVHPDDIISDYMVEIIAVEGDWSNNLKLSKDPIYKQYFDANGLKADQVNAFSALREVNVIARSNGCLIPGFIDQSGIEISIDTVFNRLFPTTNLLCALDTDKLDLIDLDETDFNDVDMATHRVDIIGHGYDDLNSEDQYTADDGTDNDDPTPLIDVLSYKEPGDGVLHYKVVIEATESGSFYTPVSGIIDPNDIIKVTTGDDYIVAMENSKLYQAYVDGFIQTGDTAVDGADANTVYLKIEDGFTTTISGQEFSYIKIFAYQDVTLLNRVDVTTYTVGADEIFKIIRSNGDDFKYTFDLNDTNFFTDYTATPPNQLVLGIAASNTAEKAIIDEFIKVNHYIKARISGDSRPRFLKIISVQQSEELSPYRLQYTVTTMAPFAEEVDGIDTASGTLEVYKGVQNFVTNYTGQYLRGFQLRKELLPDGTAQRQADILDYLFENTKIPQALADPEVIDFRYIVDSYEGEISQASKYALTKLAATRGKALAILNDPSFRQFEKSVSPSFVDQTNKIVSTRLISQGGDLSLNPQFTFKFAEEDINGIPMSTHAAFFMPYLLIAENGRSKSVPPAGYVSNVFVRKFKSGNPFLIPAGKRGVITDPEIIGLEYELTQEDRDFLEPVGHNLIVRRRGFGTLILSNNTAYQRVQSALNNLHVRDALITIENDLERILFNFLFDFNDEITRLRVRTIVENYLDSVLSARGIASYEIIFDDSNNTNEVIEANTGIIDIRVDFPRGIQKFINRITITRVGGELSAEQTGFTPSF